jgi:protease-4
MANVAASGGYYVALATEKIYANPGTLTGSIGVIINTINFEELLQNWGIELKSVTSGPYKDTGSLSRKMTPEEEAMLKELVNNVHNQFVQAVRERRRLSEEALKNLTDGRVLTGSQAYEAGLIDGLGGLEAAVKELTRLSGLKEKPKIIELKGRGFGSVLEICSKIVGTSFTHITKPGELSLKYSLN